VTSPEADGAEGLCGAAARRSAAEPEAPASGADAHTRSYTKCPGRSATAVVTAAVKATFPRNDLDELNQVQHKERVRGPIIARDRCDV
jgi:hypothetical protein